MLDHSRNSIKVVKFASDVTAQKLSTTEPKPPRLGSQRVREVRGPPSQTAYSGFAVIAYDISDEKLSQTRARLATLPSRQKASSSDNG